MTAILICIMHHLYMSRNTAQIQPKSYCVHPYYLLSVKISVRRAVAAFAADTTENGYLICCARGKVG